jgi:hypothetical protein
LKCDLFFVVGDEWFWGFAKVAIFTIRQLAD